MSSKPILDRWEVRCEVLAAIDDAQEVLDTKNNGGLGCPWFFSWSLGATWFFGSCPLTKG